MEDLKRNISEAKAFISSKSKIKPKLGIILGTGLGALAKEIKVETTIPYRDIPHFPVSTVYGHEGRLILGVLGGKKVMAMQGRFHYYEGYSLQEVTFPVRVMKAMGVDTLVVSNACGGMNPQFSRGDIMVIEDHINLFGDNPLRGPNDESLGPRFPDMSEPYSRELIALAERVALEAGIKLQKGVYVGVQGPNLETRAEYRFLRGIGADVVGMSTVPETIVAVHSGMKVLGFSVVTDLCLPDALKPASHIEIVKTASQAEPKLTKLMMLTIERM